MSVFSPAPPPGADPAPHPPHRRPQRRAAPDVQSRGDQCVQARQDGEQVRGFVPKPQTLSCHLSDNDIDKGRTPQSQEADHHKHNDAQRLLLVVPLRARRLSHQVAPGYDVQFNRHQHFGEDYHLQSHDTERVYLSRLRNRHHVLHREDGICVDPAKGANSNDERPRDEAVVEERVAHGEVAVELGEEEGQHVDTQKGGEDVEGPVAGGEPLLDVEQAEVVDREAGQRVAGARVQHEDKTVLHAQRPREGDADGHRAGHEHGAGGEQNMEDEDEEVPRSVEMDRQRDGAVEEHPDAPPDRTRV